MDDIEGRVALKIVGALVAAIEQSDPRMVDMVRDTLAIDVTDPIGRIAHGAVSGIIESRSAQPLD